MAFQLVKKKIYPRVHENELKFELNADSASGLTATNVPIVMQDEGLGDPNSAYTNPESASFAEYQGPNCYPDSRVNYARLNCEISLTKGAWNTDNVEVLKIGIIPVYMNFLENYTALNEVTSEEVEDILEMSHETTDRQGYPTWNGNKVGGDKLQTGAAVPGLTTNTNLEAITFDVNKFYDALQYYTNGRKVNKSIGRIKWLYVSRRRTLRVAVKLKSMAKRMNPYAYFGCIFVLPKENEFNQTTKNGDLTSISHVMVKASYRYNEWNENFNFMR